MEHTTLSQSGSSLFAYAFSRLRPKVFSHPIWVRFGKKNASAPQKLVDDLLNAAKYLQANDPSATCQILLICAVYQNYAGQHISALKTTQKSLELAERTGLVREIVWAIWGACAICIQQGNYQLAADNLVDLRAALNKENEWILASFIDVLKDYLFQAGVNTRAHSKQMEEQPLKDLITLTLDWLHRWGYSLYTSESEDQNKNELSSNNENRLFRLLHPSFSFRQWRIKWKSLKLVFQGELNVQFYHSSGDTETQILNETSHPTNSSPPTDPTNSSSTSIPLPEVKPLLEVQNLNISPSLEQENTTTSIAVQMLGTFSIIIQDLTIKLPSSRGLSLLKYLLLHHKQNSPREVLMEVFWPETEPETARNNLNVTIYSLRRALRKVTDLSMIVYENGTYGLAPDLKIWLDVEEFEHRVQAGQRLETRNQITVAVVEYETAISIYQGDFLEENPYEEWTIIDRERLRIVYLDMLDRLCHIYFNQERYAACITICQLLLARDRCREDAHCLLMRCYSRQGQRHLALRQYHICVESLRAELEVDPAPETTQLYDHIRQLWRV